MKSAGHGARRALPGRKRNRSRRAGGRREYRDRPDDLLIHDSQRLFRMGSTPRRGRTYVIGVSALALAVAIFAVRSSVAAQQPPRTRLVLLGTGTPNADPERSGPATAVIVDDQVYLFDAGPGVVRRAAQAARDRGIPALRPANLSRVFLTHLHSDHTVGLPDLLLSPWVLGRSEPLAVYGPPGTLGMTEGIMAAWSADVDARLNGLEPRGANPDGYRAIAHEIRPGIVYEDDLVRVEVQPVRCPPPRGLYRRRSAEPNARLAGLSLDSSYLDPTTGGTREQDAARAAGDLPPPHVGDRCGGARARDPRCGVHRAFGVRQ